jgi:hypothetical protein
MNLAAIDQIAKAVLYEGYMLYPYRPSSVKNQQRWNFGVLCPRAYSEAQSGSDAWNMQTECLIEGGSETALEIRLRFLQLVARSIGELKIPDSDLLPGEKQEIRLVPRLEVAGRVYQPWHEAAEREVILPTQNIEVLVRTPLSQRFMLSAGKQLEHLQDGTGLMVGVIEREQNALHGEVEVSSQPITDGLFKVTVRLRNLTPFAAAHESSREEALLSSLVSTHTILGVEDGRFCSLLDPPEATREFAAACQNVGTWPVLVGNEGDFDTLLSSPIILYDYPQIASESAGDLFDGTEIDEILSLRIMTLTDEEKREMRQSDERARQMLERTESLPVEQFMKLHGAVRNLRPLNRLASDPPRSDLIELDQPKEEPR